MSLISETISAHQDEKNIDDVVAIETAGANKQSEFTAVDEKVPGIPSYKTWQNNTANAWWNDRGLRLCMIDIVILFGSIFANGFDTGLIVSFQANAPWNEYFDHPTGAILGLVVAAYAFPMLAFPVLASWFADRYGRRPVILAGGFCGILGPLLSGLAKSKDLFIGGRVITGLSAAFFQPTAPPLIAEIAHPRFRAVVGGTYLGMYYVGAVIVSWLGFGMVKWGSPKGWRIMTILQMIGCVPLTVWSATFMMSESPRYLVKRGRHPEALKILARFHANGDENDELVQNEMKEIVTAVELDAAADKSSYLDFFRSGGNKKRFWLIVWFSWAQSMSGNNLMGAYLPQVLALSGINNDAQVQAIFGGLLIFLLFVSLGSAQLVEKVGRRPLVLWSGLFLVVFFTLVTALSGSFARSGSVPVGLSSIPFIYIALAFYCSAMVPLPYLYIPEITPYQLRSKGLAVFTILSALGQLYNSFVNPVALVAIGWKYYIIFLVTDAIQLIIAYFIVVETKGLTLEDIAIVFDGEETLLSRTMGEVPGRI